MYTLPAPLCQDSCIEWVCEASGPLSLRLLPPAHGPSLEQGDVISKVVVLLAQTTEAPPLAQHEAERQHEEGADGGHDIGDGHESGLVSLWNVVATVLHVRRDKGALHGRCPELIMH